MNEFEQIQFDASIKVAEQYSCNAFIFPDSNERTTWFVKGNIHKYKILDMFDREKIKPIFYLWDSGNLFDHILVSSKCLLFVLFMLAALFSIVFYEGDDQKIIDSTSGLFLIVLFFSVFFLRSAKVLIIDFCQNDLRKRIIWRVSFPITRVALFDASLEKMMDQSFMSNLYLDKILRSTKDKMIFSGKNWISLSEISWEVKSNYMGLKYIIFVWVIGLMSLGLILVMSNNKFFLDPAGSHLIYQIYQIVSAMAFLMAISIVFSLIKPIITGEFLLKSYVVGFRCDGKLIPVTNIFSNEVARDVVYKLQKISLET